MTGLKSGASFERSSCSGRLAKELQAALERVDQPNVADGRTDLDARLTTLMRNYRAQYEAAGLGASMSISDSRALGTSASAASAASAAFPEPAVEPDEAVANFRKWRHGLLEKATDLDAVLPPLPFAAERLRRDVDDAFAKIGGVDSMQSYISQCTVRQLGALHCHRNMVHGRSRLYSHQAPRGRFVEAPGAGAALDALLRHLSKEIGATGHRLRCAALSNAGPSNFEAETSSIGSTAVLVRRQMSEDVATRQLRFYLCKLQHATVTHRTQLWRRTLEFRAAAEATTGRPIAGVAPVSGSAAGEQAPALPFGPVSKRDVERAVQELGAKYGVYVQLFDKGKAFFHQVGVVFAPAFERQQRRTQFQAHPGGSYDRDVDKINSQSIVKEGQGSVAGAGVDIDMPRLRPSSWARHVPWRGRIDPCILEQGVLLSSSFSAAQRPSRIHVGGEVSYARGLVEDAAASGKLEDGEEWDADVDSVLRAERAFLEAGDLRQVVGRLVDMADAAGPESATTVSAPVLKSFYLLRYLQCREKRRRLLSFLNFCRSVQRRLVLGLTESAAATGDLATAPGQSAEEANRTTSKSGFPDRMREQDPANDESRKYWDFTPQKLAKLCQELSTPGLTTSDADGTSRDNGLDRERFAKGEDDEMEVIDEDGNTVVHTAALDDLRSLERELLSVGSYYIHRYEGTSLGRDVDRRGVVFDLYSAEAWFCSEKQRLLEAYLEIYEHTVDPPERWDLSQRIIDVMATRPRLDLESEYFTESYAASICVLQSRAGLLRQLLQSQIHAEREVMLDVQRELPNRKPMRGLFPDAGGSFSLSSSGRRLMRKVGSRAESQIGFMSDSSASQRMSAVSPLGASGDGVDALYAHPREGYGASSYCNQTTHVRLTPSAEPVAADEFFGSACLTWKVELLMEEALRNLREHFHPESPVMVTYLERACYTHALDSWREVQERARLPFGPRPRSPHDDPEFAMTQILAAAQEFTRLMAAQSSTDIHAEESVKAFEADANMQRAFAEIRRVCEGTQDMFAQMLVNLLEHFRVRRCLAETAVEVMLLESAAKVQSAGVGVKVEHRRPAPMGKPSKSARAREEQEYAWIDPYDHARFPGLTAGFFSADMRSIPLKNAYDVVLQCSTIHQLRARAALQHEVAWRNLLQTCLESNALLSDQHIRQRECIDITTVGPSREMVKDASLAVLRRLRETVELAGRREAVQLAGPMGGVASKAVVEQQVPFDTRNPNWQNPFALIAPVLAAAGRLHVEHIREPKEDLDDNDSWYRLLPCSSACLTRIACDVKVRTQAANTALGLRAIVSAIPARLSPFSADDKKQTLVDKDGQVVNLFYIPTIQDMLSLRGIRPDTDLDATMASILKNVEAAEAGRAQSQSRRSKYHSQNENLTDQSISEGRTLDRIQSERPTFAVERSIHLGKGVSPILLKFEYDGPAACALKLLHELFTFVGLRYALCAIGGDPLTLLRMQRHARFNAAELDRMQSVGSFMSKTDPTYEALACFLHDSERLTRRFDAVVEGSSAAGAGFAEGDRPRGSNSNGPVGARDAESVLALVRTESTASYCRLVVLMRAGARARLRAGEEEDTALLRRWALYLRYPGRSSAPLPPLPRQPLHGTPERCASARSAGLGATAVAVPVLASLEVLAARNDVSAIAADEGEDSKMAGGSPRTSAAGQNNGAAASSRDSSGAAEVKEMSWDAMRRDVARYMSSFQSDSCARHPWLDPLVHTVLGSHASDPDAPDSAADRSERKRGTEAWLGPVGLSSPPDQLQNLRSGICALPAPLRRQLASLQSEFMAKRKAFLTVFAKEQGRGTVDSAEADCDFFGAHILLDELRERVLCLSLAETPAVTLGALARFDIHFEIHFPREFVGAAAVADHAKEVSTEMKGIYHRISALVASFDRLLASAACEGLERQLLGIVSLRRRSMAALSAQLGPSRVAHAEEHGTDHHAGRVDIVVRAFNRLRRGATFVSLEKESTDAERAYVIRSSDLDACVEDLLRGAVTWGKDLVQSREMLAQGLAEYRVSRLDTLGMEHAMHRNYVVRNAPGSERAATLVKREVADRGCRLVFEVDRVHRCVQDIQQVTRELEYRLSSETWEKIRELVSEVASSLTVALGRFHEGHGGCAQHVATQMRAIREQVAGDFAALAMRSHAAQERATREREQARAEDAAAARAAQSGLVPQEDAERVTVTDGIRCKALEVARRDDQRILRLQIEDVKNRILCARTFNHFKFQAMRQKFDDQMMSLCMTLASNRELLERLAEASQGHAVTAAKFCEVAQEMAIAGSRMEERVAQAEVNVGHRQRLQSVKRMKGRQVQHVENKIREHIRLGTEDIEGLLEEIKDKQQIVVDLTSERRAEDDAVDREYKRNEAETASIRQQWRAGQSAKLAARDNLDKRRREAEQQPLSDSDRLLLWTERNERARARLAELQEENRRLKHLAAVFPPEASEEGFGGGRGSLREQDGY